MDFFGLRHFGMGSAAGFCMFLIGHGTHSGGAVGKQEYSDSG